MTNRLQKTIIAFGLCHMSLHAASPAKSIVKPNAADFSGVTALSTINRPLNEIRNEKAEAQTKEIREQNETYHKYKMQKQIEDFKEFNNQNIKYK